MIQKPFAIALAGLLSLAVVMGIGRFAFTPLLPMMLHEGAVDLSQASWLAFVNYLGYWIGAVACALQPWIWSRCGFAQPIVHTAVIRFGLVATVVLTLGMAWPWPSAWPAWRFLAGVASAFVLVFVSSWALARLAALGEAKLAGIIFVGPGVGIAVSGLAAMCLGAYGWSAAAGWMVFGVLAALLTLLAWPQLQGSVKVTAISLAPPLGSSFSAMALLSIAYGFAGFGYIITATFLPVIARQMLPGSVWLDLFWPLFGVGVACGALLTIRMPVQWDRRRLLMGAYAMQAAGIMLGVWWPSLAGLALGSLLIGLPFTAITLFAMQEVRRLQPHRAASSMGLLSAVYGLGQIAGPAWVGLLLHQVEKPVEGFAIALQSAAGSLLLGMVIFAWLAKMKD